MGPLSIFLKVKLTKNAGLGWKWKRKKLNIIEKKDGKKTNKPSMKVKKKEYIIKKKKKKKNNRVSGYGAQWLFKTWSKKEKRIIVEEKRAVRKAETRHSISTGKKGWK